MHCPTVLLTCDEVFVSGIHLIFLSFHVLPGAVSSCLRVEISERIVQAFFFSFFFFFSIFYSFFSFVLCSTVTGILKSHNFVIFLGVVMNRALLKSHIFVIFVRAVMTRALLRTIQEYKRRSFQKNKKQNKNLG